MTTPATIKSTITRATAKTWMRRVLMDPLAMRRDATGSSTKPAGNTAEAIIPSAATPNATWPATVMSATCATTMPGTAKSTRASRSPGVRGRL